MSDKSMYLKVLVERPVGAPADCELEIESDEELVVLIYTREDYKRLIKAYGYPIVRDNEEALIAIRPGWRFGAATVGERKWPALNVVLSCIKSLGAKSAQDIIDADYEHNVDGADHLVNRIIKAGIRAVRRPARKGRVHPSWGDGMGWKDR